MSKFAKIPVQVPETVKFEFTNHTVKISGPKGNMERKFPDIVEVETKDGELFVKTNEKVETKFGRSIVGTVRSHIVNMITGVTEGWNKKMELQGTGFRAELKGNDLVLTVGFSHTVSVKAPEGIKFTIEKNIISIDGINKEIVSELAAEMRAIRPPDPYKGKGIRYLGEYLKLKPGKQAAKTGGTA
ncbi:50S ribosomal protein L6 [soil metagenome]